MPVFITAGKNIKRKLEITDETYLYSVDRVIEEIAALKRLGINNLALFELSEKKDLKASAATDSAMAGAIKALKEEHPDCFIVCDLCVCQFTTHGHCGILEENGKLDLRATIKCLTEMGLSYAKAGADALMPSGMNCGMVSSLRDALHRHGLKTLLMPQAKFSSALYVPFRQVAHGRSSLAKHSYQIDPSSGNQALREIQALFLEGADMVVVKPAFFCSDIIKLAAEQGLGPIGAFVTSGETALLCAEQRQNSPAQAKELHAALIRSGASFTISYLSRHLISG